jgi:hypothetical protein
MRKVAFFVPIIFGISACGMLKNDAQKAEEAYEGMKSQLSPQEKCVKLTELSDLYYAENDTYNYDKWKFQKEQMCKAVKAVEDIKRSINNLSGEYDGSASRPY